MDNTTNSSTTIYSPEGIAIIMAGVAAAIGSVVYSLKSVKHSDCMGAHCDQKVVNDCPEPVVKERVLTFV